MYKNSITVPIHNGIHTRIAAMIVHKVAELKSKYGVNLYIRNLSSKEPLAISMLALISLKIREDEIIEISCKEDSINGQKSVIDLCNFITKDMATNNSVLSKIDDIIEENTIAYEQIVENIPVGILVIDIDGYITVMNDYALKIIDKKANDVIGRYVKDILPTTDLTNIVLSKKRKVGETQYINNRLVITSKSPIFSNNKVIGALGVFQAVDELKDIVKKLEESEEELNYYKEELKRHTELVSSFDSIIGCSSSLKDCLIIAQKASQSTSTVLIRGESGTGKEVIAKAIHNNSIRKDMPFVRVNCAAIPENLLESELFGYEKGAFTGAIKSKPGKFNIANGGTIFLDEIGDMPLSMQVKLLRVLQEREFESVGGLTTQTVDVRIIAATNRNLEKMIEQNNFREDLYYRLNVISIMLPPLRQRKEDINLLAEHFIHKISNKLNKSVSGIDNKSLIHLQEYHWPGNIRELENIIERAINMCDDTIITEKDLPFYIVNTSPERSSLINLKNGELHPLEYYEKEIIALAMKKYKSYNKAGKALGITHRTVALKCKKYNINIESI
ncbi:sigma 54-interacting transcriptional regulator [Clostridium aciditolerans]|uniref:HTH-type transcriptional regulatory protein TyrR n=1 Tax=Clostridium aciditolerans TaxID=339861 RepID=A0A934I5K2_9CLOT|nr:sigma 54-interacting transcriptional regulator [Clostridium aciditolerans]MBI6875381.1 sigma 54-interacting transcriptional regulator [Clostridium aciditolerans]